MALAALATAIARPIVVFAPSSRRVETPTLPRHVFLALAPPSTSQSTRNSCTSTTRVTRLCALVGTTLRPSPAVTIRLRRTSLTRRGYKCNHCPRSYTERTSFKRHVQLEHPQENALGLLYCEYDAISTRLTPGAATPGSAGDSSVSTNEPLPEPAGASPWPHYASLSRHHNLIMGVAA